MMNVIAEMCLYYREDFKVDDEIFIMYRKKIFNVMIKMKNS